jgi:hypothetical protein
MPTLIRGEDVAYSPICGAKSVEIAVCPICGSYSDLSYLGQDCPECEVNYD